MTATGNESVKLSQLKMFSDSMGGGSIKLLYSGNDFHIEFEYGDKSYMLFILMNAGGQNLMEMAFCTEGMYLDLGFSPESGSTLYSVECADGLCCLTCANDYNSTFRAVWGTEIEMY